MENKLIITAFITFLLLGGWKILFLLIGILLGHLLGYPTYWIRILIKETTGWDFLETAPDLARDEDDALLWHAIAGAIFLVCGLFIWYYIIPNLSHIIIGVTIIILLLALGNGFYWIISKLFKITTKPGKILSAIAGNIAIIVIVFAGYYLRNAFMEILTILKNYF